MEDNISIIELKELLSTKIKNNIFVNFITQELKKNFSFDNYYIKISDLKNINHKNLYTIITKTYNIYIQELHHSKYKNLLDNSDNEIKKTYDQLINIFSCL
jgi:hypothetical protein